MFQLLWKKEQKILKCICLKHFSNSFLPAVRTNFSVFIWPSLAGEVQGCDSSAEQPAWRRGAGGWGVSRPCWGRSQLWSQRRKYFHTLTIPYACGYPLIVEQRPWQQCVSKVYRTGFSWVAEGLACLPPSSQWEDRQPGAVIKPRMTKHPLSIHFYPSTALISCVFSVQSPRVLWWNKN